LVEIVSQVGFPLDTGPQRRRHLNGTSELPIASSENRTQTPVLEVLKPHFEVLAVLHV